MEAKNVRLAALNLEGISGVDLGGLRIRNGDFRESQVHLNARVSHFRFKCHLFLCKFGRIHDLRCAWEFLNVGCKIPGHRSA